MTSLSIGHHPVVRPVVSAVSTQLPQFGGDDAGEGTHGGLFDGVPLGAFLMLSFVWFCLYFVRIVGIVIFSKRIIFLFQQH